MPNRRRNAIRTNCERCRNFPTGTWHVCRFHGGEPLPVPKPCRCRAYQWPHRCGSGVCRWPEEPKKPCPTPRGTHKHHSRWRAKIYAWKRLFIAAEQADRVATRAAVERCAALRRELEAIALQAKALELVARAEAEADVRAAVVALKEARECVEFRARIGAELLAPSNVPASLRVEYCEPETFADLARSARDTLTQKLEALRQRLPSADACPGEGTPNPQGLTGA